MNSVFQNNNPITETIECAEMVYNRFERRNNTFCVIVDNEFAVVKKWGKNMQADTVLDINNAGTFTWKGAMRVLDHFIKDSPVVKLIYLDPKTNKRNYR